jgi:pilus assembly protein Flp/PilA
MLDLGCAEEAFQPDETAYPRSNRRQPQGRSLEFDIEGVAKMLSTVRKIWDDDEGQDIAEYGLMLAVILLIVVAAVTAIGTNANTVFNSVAGQLTAS